MLEAIRRVGLAGLTTLAIACTGGGRPRSLSPGCTALAGCRHRIVSTSSSLELLDAVTFSGGTAELAPPSYRTLEHVAHTLIANPSLRVIEVRGHGDAVPLAQQRAEVVAAYLRAQGVAAARLVTRGVSEGDDDARSRQVEFLILARED